jgi:hypothetical protein
VRPAPAAGFACLLALVAPTASAGKVVVEPNPSGSEPYLRCARACEACVQDCDTATRRLEGRPAADWCAECRQVCEKAARLLTARNPTARDTYVACARSCLACAVACEQSGDDAQARRCARACRECATACQEFVAFLDWCHGS